jgi:hypothetical protein
MMALLCPEHPGHPPSRSVLRLWDGGRESSTPPSLLAISYQIYLIRQRHRRERKEGRKESRVKEKGVRERGERRG